MEKTEPILTHGDCPDCGGHGCYTEWANGAGYCHQCPPDKAKKKPTGMKGGSMSYDFSALEMKTLGYRSIDKDVAEFFGIQTGCLGDEEVLRVYPYPHHVRNRVLPKDFTKNKGFTNDYLFGMDKFNAGSSKFLTIVEGEDDVPSAYQMLGKSHHVVGLAGVGSVKKTLENRKCYDFIDAYSQVIIAVDSDEPGNNAADMIQRAFPGKSYRVNMTKHKDPNDYLTNGDENDFKYAWINRKKYVPNNIFNTPEQFKKILREGSGYAMLPTGIKEFDDLTGGLAQGAFTVLQAPEGIGKTELMRYFEYRLLSEYPTVPFATMHLEETKKRGLLGLSSYFLEKDVTMQDSKFEMKDGDLVQSFLPSYKGTPESEVEAVIESFTEKENFYQFSMGVEDSPDNMLGQIRYFAEVCGCKYVFFEPIQDLAYSREDTSDVEPWLRDFSTKLGRLAAELNVGIVTIAHENDDGQIRDCRMIGKRAHVVVKLERDKLAQDEELRNTTILTVVKNRPTSSTGYAGQLMFDPYSFTIKEK